MYHVMEIFERNTMRRFDECRGSFEDLEEAKKCAQKFNDSDIEIWEYEDEEHNDDNYDYNIINF